MPSPDLRGYRAPFVPLLRKELRDVTAGRAFWVMLLVVAPLTGYSHAQAVALYAEASRAAAQFPELARGLSPLDGIVVPTLGALYLGATFLFPFVAIRALGEEKTSGGVRLLVQLPYPTVVLVGAKLLAVTAAWVALLVPGLIALALWRSTGGHLAWGETASVVLGHGLYALVVGGLALAAAAVTEGGASAAILTIGATLGFWVLDFAAAGGDGPLRELSGLSLTALLRTFESGILSLGAVLGALAATAGLLALAAIWLRPARSVRTRLALSALCAAATAAAVGMGTGLRAYRDASEDRRNSFAPADEAALRGLERPLRIEVRLAAEDPRYHDLQRRILGKLERVAPDVEVTRVVPGRSALFADGGDQYGLVEYVYGGRRASSRSTSEREVLPLLFQLAGVVRPIIPGAADYPGHPHVADSRSAELWLYAGAPILVLGGWAWARGNRRNLMAWASGFAAAGLAGALAFPSLFAPAAVASVGAGGDASFDFSGETVGAPPQSFVPVVGNWLIGDEDGNRVLVVDGRSWRRGQTAAGLADRARSLYGERYAEFLDSVQAFAYFPYAVAAKVEDFRDGKISLRFKGIDGRIDQAMGILFDLKPNGDYLTVRANPLEDNLVLWSFIRGKRSSVKWIRNTPTPTRHWHDLEVVIKGRAVEGYLDGTLYLSHTLERPVSGRVGLWSKADSVVYVDDFRVRPAGER